MSAILTYISSASFTYSLKQQMDDNDNAVLCYIEILLLGLVVQVVQVVRRQVGLQWVMVALPSM